MAFVEDVNAVADADGLLDDNPRRGHAESEAAGRGAVFDDIPRLFHCFYLVYPPQNPAMATAPLLVLLSAV